MTTHIHTDTHSHATPVICVTGSAKRIGATIIEHMHALGYAVIIHCHSSVDAANALAKTLNDQRENSAKVLQADLANTQGLVKFANDLLDCFGRLDVLVHNASRFYPTELEHIQVTDLETTKSTVSTLENQWDELFASNAKAPFFLTQLLKSELKKQNGCVISLLDIHANDRPFRGYAIYNMAKSAHRMLVKSLSLELAPTVRVNGIAPGANIWPDAQSDQAITHHTQDAISKAIPMQRVGNPQDIADAVAYLAKANYVTGHVINVDGGRSLTLAGN